MHCTFYNMCMNGIKLEWDEEKEKINIKKHGISFSTAAFVFNDPNRLEYYDEEHRIATKAERSAYYGN